MREIVITANDAGRRVDRFLRKYLVNASLGQIYKIIRKDLKVDGKRKNEAYMLSEGEVLTLYMSDEDFAKMTGGHAEAGDGKFGGDRARGGDAAGRKAKRQVKIVYEDANVLIADKPYGLLTHGDVREKKNHLANQVKDYLIERLQRPNDCSYCALAVVSNAYFVRALVLRERALQRELAIYISVHNRQVILADHVLANHLIKRLQRS